MRIVVLKAAEADLGNIQERNLPPLLRRNALELQSEFNVAQDRPPRIEPEILEHDSAVRPGPADHVAVDQNTTLIRLDQSVDNPKQGGLAATTRTDHRNEVTLRHGKAHAVKSRNADDVVLHGLEEGLMNVFDRKLGHSRRIDSCQRQAYMLSASDILKPAGSYFRLRECCHRCDKGRREQRAGKISRKRCGGRCRICARESILAVIRKLPASLTRLACECRSRVFCPMASKRAPYRRAPLLAQPL